MAQLAPTRFPSSLHENRDAIDVYFAKLRKGGGVYNMPPSKTPRERFSGYFRVQPLVDLGLF